MPVALLPVLGNVVHQLVMECAASEGRREDPSVRAARMSMEEVFRIVREEEPVWYDDVDWEERRRSDYAVKRRKRVQRAREDLRPMTIPVSPVLSPPRLLRPIPHVPVTTANVPHYSLEAFKAVSFHFHIFLSPFIIY